MEKIIKKLSPATFGIALICFLLPWVRISCQGERVASFSGIQLVTGTAIEEPQMFGPKKERKVNGEPLAILAFLTAIAGFGIGFLKGKKWRIGSAIASGVGIILLFMLKSKLNNDILRESENVLQVDYGVGFYLTLIFFFFAILVNIYSINAEEGMSLPQIKGQDVGYKFCSQCGAKIETGAFFCSECGHSLK